MRKKKLLVIALIVGALAAYFAFDYYQKIYGKNVLASGAVFIKTNTSLETLSEQLESMVRSKESFLWVAHKKSFTKPKGGKYVISKDMSNNDLVNLLRSGNQTPVTVTFNNQDYLDKFAGRISEQIEADSAALIAAFLDKNFLEKQGFTSASVLGMFIPNTYQLYWNTSAEDFRDRMLREYKKFWNSDRLRKAKDLDMTPAQVMVLASIVQKETAKKSERPRVAGLYLNRIRRGWPLQADPTVIYALKLKKGRDFVVKRVLYADLKLDSPYNTYTNRGLPPSLIAMPDISSIDGVLNAEKHNYLYMCVNVEKFGYHAFAESQAQHNRNAAKYQRWLNQQGILR